MSHSYSHDVITIGAASPRAHVLLRSFVIGLTAFLTVVDLFATQAILPSLARHYNVSAAAMGFAVNASTMGMAIGALLVGMASAKIDRRTGILLSLALLSIPTALLASAPNLAVFALLRVLQGLCMSSAFALTLAYLGEECSMTDTGGAFAAYITGNVASNLVGRLIAAAVSETLGLATNFYLFALLNLAGAVLVYFSIQQAERTGTRERSSTTLLSALLSHLRDPGLRSAFMCGFCILFAFIGTFTYVNFVLVKPPLSLNMMQLGLVYLVFLPSIFTTLLAGAAVRRFGTRFSLCSGIVIAGAGVTDASGKPLGACADRARADRHRNILRTGSRDGICRPRRFREEGCREWLIPGLLFLWRSLRQRSTRSALRSPRLDGLRRWDRDGTHGDRTAFEEAQRRSQGS